jgi:tetratricopeptide (TPR) repeat protein
LRFIFGKLRNGFILLLLSIYLTLSGCSGVLLHNWPQSHEYIPDRYVLNSVLFYPQKAYQCGPAALAMALEWSGVPSNPEALVPEVFTPSRKGSLQSTMIAASRRHGRIAYSVSGPDALLAELSAGHPVIVLQNLSLSWFPAWHYAVVIGYDLPKAVIVLHSGITPRKQISLRLFENTWARSNYWGLLVLPPSQLPATATEREYISAILGLEKTSQWKAAVEGYETALKRWPDSLLAHVGLGNSYYALSDFESAEKIFREATCHYPTQGSIFNNLAQVLWKQGKNQEALKAAYKAVKLGGPLANIYQKTLEEIQAWNSMIK